jgi:hypothetical protein
MGLLDDLKKQAESRQQLPPSHEEALLKHGYFDAVQIALLNASRYFGELANSLNVVKPDVQRQYYIEGSTRLTGLKQYDYTARDKRKTFESRDYLTEVSLLLTCQGNENLTFEKDTPRAIENMNEYFWGYSLPFECREVRNERAKVEKAVFTLIAKVPASITLAGNWDTGAFKLTLRNLEVLGNVEQSFGVADISHELLEEIGKLVLAQPNNLRDFGKLKEPQPMSILPTAERAEAPYPIAPDTLAPEPAKGGLVGALKSLIKR